MKVRRLTVVIATLVMMILCAMPGLAQVSGKIAGKVRDQLHKEPLPGVNILLKGTKLGAMTDVDGSYFILNVPPGTYELTTTHIGYQSVTQKNVIVNVNRTTTADFQLTETALPLDEVVITAERPDVEREKTSTSDIWRGEDIVSRAGVTDIAQVIAFSSDVSDDHFRGGREGEELYTLQGMGIINPLDQTTMFAPIISAVEEVEVITSGFSAQYGNAQSGVVNISMKEGRSDKWTGRAEARVRLPGRKHFGPSVWDPAGQPYLQVLNTWEKWLANNPNSNTPAPFFSIIGNGFDSRYGRDTATLAQIAYTLWRLQGKRTYGQSYDKLVDAEGELTLGGPIAPDIRVFLAGRSDNEWSFLPTEDPNKMRTFMGNIVFDVVRDASLRLSGAYTNNQEYVFRSTRTNGFYSWTWDQALGLGKRKTNNYQLGARVTYALNKATFFDLKINSLRTDLQDGSPAIDPNGWSGDPIWQVYSTSSAPDGFLYGNLYDTFRDEKTRTTSIDGSMTSQISLSHLIMAGVQANFYSVEVNDKRSVKSANSAKVEVYNARPFELGIYGSDKMEFEGMIANVGLRLDLWDQNVKYYADLYSPFRYRVNDTVSIIDMTRALKAETPMMGRLQPRLGISFPVSITTVFHVNYGTYVQRPPLNQTAYQQMPKSGFATMILGNPRLRPQVTNSYDIGVMQGLADGFTLDISGYYKDVKDLIQQAFYYDKDGNYYSSFMNRDYADIRGFKVGIARRRGAVTGTLNYTYGVATGKNATPFNSSPIFFENDPSANKYPSPKDVLLDFDRTHNVVLSAVLTFEEEEGPDIFGERPLQDMRFAITSFARSGRPYTYDDQGLGLLFNRRAPAEYSTTLRITKDLRRIIGNRMSFYLEVQNLFNQKILSYQAVFGNTRDNSSGTITENRNIQRYIEDPASIRFTEDINHVGFVVDQSFLIYDNMPRSFSVGMVINF